MIHEFYAGDLRFVDKKRIEAYSRELIRNHDRHVSVIDHNNLIGGLYDFHSSVAHYIQDLLKPVFEIQIGRPLYSLHADTIYYNKGGIISPHSDRAGIDWSGIFVMYMEGTDTADFIVDGNTYHQKLYDVLLFKGSYIHHRPQFLGDKLLTSVMFFSEHIGKPVARSIALQGRKDLLEAA